MNRYEGHHRPDERPTVSPMVAGRLVLNTVIYLVVSPLAMWLGLWVVRSLTSPAGFSLSPREEAFAVVGFLGVLYFPLFLPLAWAYLGVVGRIAKRSTSTRAARGWAIGLAPIVFSVWVPILVSLGALRTVIVVGGMAVAFGLAVRLPRPAQGRETQRAHLPPSGVVGS